MTVEPERVRKVNSSPNRPDRQYVLYWAQMNRRVDSNHGLLYAAELANSWSLPVLFYEGLTCTWTKWKPWRPNHPVLTCNHMVAHVPVFAALGDETRLFLVAKLVGGGRVSIAQLTQGSKLTRQAITKHLRVLERAGIVHSLRAGRESLFEFTPQSIAAAKDYLDVISREWGEALGRLKTFVEIETGSPDSG